MKKVTLFLLMAAVFFFAACSQNETKSEKSKTDEKVAEQTKEVKSNQLSGDYLCSEHWNKDLIGKAKISFDKDSVDFSGMAKTTYRTQGDSLFIDMHAYEMGFLMDGNTLKASGSAGDVAYTKQ